MARYTIPENHKEIKEFSPPPMTPEIWIAIFDVFYSGAVLIQHIEECHDCGGKPKDKESHAQSRRNPIAQVKKFEKAASIVGDYISCPPYKYKKPEKQ